MVVMVVMVVLAAPVEVVEAIHCLEIWGGSAVEVAVEVGPMILLVVALVWWAMGWRWKADSSHCLDHWAWMESIFRRQTRRCHPCLHPMSLQGDRRLEHQGQRRPEERVLKRVSCASRASERLH